MKLACAWLSSKPHEEFTYDSNKWSLKDDLVLVIFHQSIGFVIWILFFESCHCDEFSNEEFINNKKMYGCNPLTLVSYNFFFVIVIKKTVGNFTL
jgi:hypothetical protein